MNLKNKNKHRDFFGQEVFCTDAVKDYIVDLIDNQSITKLSTFSEYLLPFNDIVYPVLLTKTDNNHLFVTDSNKPATIKEISLCPSPQGGTISLFYKDEAGYSIEKTFSLIDSNLIYINKAIDNIQISVGYSDGIDSSIYAIVKSVDSLTDFVQKHIEVSLDDFLVLENLEYGFIEETLAAFKSDKFIIRSSSLEFYDIFSHYSDAFSVEIHNNGECLKFATIPEKGSRLSAKLLTPKYGVSISINLQPTLDEVKNLYFSFLSTNFEIFD